MENGHASELYKKFTKVFSGHYHTRSTDGTIHYLGNPYEMFANDVGDRRGFTIFDTETKEFFPVDNPYRLFYNVYYEDTPAQTFDTRELENKIDDLEDQVDILQKKVEKLDKLEDLINK